MMMDSLDELPRRLWHLRDQDELFENTTNKVLLNSYDFSKPGYAQTLSEHICAHGGDVDFISRCDCEYLVGNFYIGQTCPKCKTVVEDGMRVADSFKDYRVWVRLPAEIKGALSPIAFMILRTFLKYQKSGGSNYVTEDLSIANADKEKKGNFLEDILDVTTPPHPLIADAVPGKGFNYFFDNFDYIMDYFLTRDKRTSSKKGAPMIREWIKKYRNVLFCRHFALLANTLHAVISSDVNKESKRKFVDKHCQLSLHAAQTLGYLEFKSGRRKNMVEIERKTFNAYQHLMGYYFIITKTQLGEKKALPRMHLFGSRLHLSFRSVISPITGPHCIDELYVPFSVASNTFRTEILGRLQRDYGMTLSEAYEKQQNSLTMFDEDVYQILCNLIQECPYKGIPVLWVRNPVVRVGGVELMFVTQIKTDMKDETISMSALMCPFSNADFDGDAKNGFRIPENNLVEKFMLLHASNVYLSQYEPAVTSHITIPKITQITANKFLGRV